MIDNNNQNKRLVKNTLLLYVRMLLTMIISLYTSRIVLQTLGIEDFGIYNVIGGVVALCSFFNNSLSASTQRFLNYELARNNIYNLKKVFSISLISFYCLSIFLFILLETVGIWFIYHKLNIPESRMNAAIWTFQFSILTFLCSIISIPYNATIIAHEKMSAFAYISIVEVILKLICIYCLIWITYDKLITYSILLFIISLITRLIYIIYCKKSFEECKFQFIWDKQLVANIFSFSGWMFFGTITQILKDQGINILINILGGAIYNAARGIALQVYRAVYSFVENFMTAVRPQIIKLYSKQEYTETFSLIYRSSKLSFYILFCISLPILLNIDYILLLWLKQVPYATNLFTQLTIIESLIGCLFTPLGNLSQATGKIKYYQILISLTFLTNFILTYILYKLGYPIITTLWIAIIISSVGLFIRIFYLHKQVGISLKQYTQSVLLKIIYVTSISVLISIPIHQIIDITSLSKFFLTSIYYIIVTFIVTYCIGLDKVEKNYIKNKIQKIYDKNRYSPNINT